MRTFSFRFVVFDNTKNGNTWYVNADGFSLSDALGKAWANLLRQYPNLVYVSHEVL